jgi:hypothetical protein
MVHDPWSVLIKIFRGFLWVATGYPVAINLPRAKHWKSMISVGLALSFGLETPLFVPNPYTPGVVR